MQKSDFYQYGWVIFLYAYLLIVSNFVPRGPAQTAWGMSGMVIIIAGIFIQDQIFMRLTNPYPYLRFKVDPDGYILRFYVDKKGGFIERPPEKPGDYHTTTLKLKYASFVPRFGQVKEVILNHDLSIMNRLKWKPGRCLFKSYQVDHPMTTTGILYEYPRGIDIEYAEKKPVFFLHHAGKDYFRGPQPLSGAMTSLDKANAPLLVKQSIKISQLTSENAELRRQRDYYQTGKVKKEEEVVRQEAEIKGLLSSSTDQTQDVVRDMLAFREKFRTIDNALRHIKGTPFTFNRTMGLVMIVAISAVFLYAMKDNLAGFGEWLAAPVNLIISVIVGVLTVIVLWLLLVARPGKRK